MVPNKLQQLPRFPLAQLPTPLEPLRRLSALLTGPQVFIKRDDQTGLGLGGNKTRKLEYLVGEAIARGADTLITAGAAQSNHCRQTAAAAARAGLRCELVLGGDPAGVPEGNLLLDELFGAVVRWSGPERRGETLDSVAAGLRASGLKPYVIPYGGSNPTGAAGYANALVELTHQAAAQSLRVDAIVFPSSSGGTQAGLLAGAVITGFQGRIIGVGIDKREGGAIPLADEIRSLAQQTLGFITEEGMKLTRSVEVDQSYQGAGYGIVGGLEREAIKLLARTEGILVDPVYTGRAMGGLLDMIRQHRFEKDQNVLFWHTGGTPALFAYARDLMT
jgi:D-cysteine desulfhydrase